MVPAFLLLFLNTWRTSTALAVADCGNSSSLCPDANVELYCQTSVPVLIWNVDGIELDFHIKDSVGATESSGRFTAELTGRNGGTQSRLHFRMETSLNGTVVECLDALGGFTSCLVQLTDLPGPPVNLTCHSDETNSTAILVWSPPMKTDSIYTPLQGFEIFVFPSAYNLSCKQLHRNTTSTSFVFTMNSSSCVQASYVVRAVNCLGAGQGVSCTVDHYHLGYTDMPTSIKDTSSSNVVSLISEEDLSSSLSTLAVKLNTNTGEFYVYMTEFSTISSQGDHHMHMTNPLNVGKATTRTQASIGPTHKQEEFQTEMLFIIVGCSASVTVGCCAAVSLFISALVVRKKSNCFRRQSSNISTHQEQEWINMTTNVVYDHNLQLQDNSAYESHVIYDSPLQLQDNSAYQSHDQHLQLQDNPAYESHVVYDSPLQLQDNSAYQSHVVHDKPLQLQDNSDYESIS